MTDNDRRNLRDRIWDRANLLGDLAAVLCMAAFAAFLYAAVQRIGRDETHRVVDLRSACRRTSARNATDLNLNWVYYESEVLLGGHEPGQKLGFAPASGIAAPTGLPQRALEQLSPHEQAFIRLLARGGTGSRLTLEARANADYHAAMVKARTVDFRDVGLIAVRTQLGDSNLPRRWVLSARYDCSRLYR